MHDREVPALGDAEYSALGSENAPEHSSRTAVTISLLLSLAIGVLLPIQARVTGQLGKEMGDGMLAGWLTSAVGLLFAGLLALALPSARRSFVTIPEAIKSRAFPLWAMAAGFIAAYFVVTQGVVSGITGVALFTIAFVAGQLWAGSEWICGGSDQRVESPSLAPALWGL